MAKLCGVKCEKFYLGFDIAGLKFCKFRWGETEYGIGILPLGGYVKMLGQEDNPGQAPRGNGAGKARGGGEREQGAGSGAESRTAAWRNRPNAPTIPNRPPLSPPLFDPRSFLAKSVPKRMAIISAGVIMNVIFAFLMAVVAFCIGVPEIPCVVGDVLPGEGAWQADLRPGDEILKIAGKEMRTFRDLQTAITLGRHRPGERHDPARPQRRKGACGPIHERQARATRSGRSLSA